MRVHELMSTDLVTVERDASLAPAVERMLAAGAGSAIVVSPDGAPVGIVTSSDVLRATLDTGVPLSDIPVEDVLSAPLVTVEPNASVNRALELMAEHEVKKLPVLDGLELAGVVTTTDVARQLPEYVSAIRSLESKRPRRKSE